jgi:tetrahydromethanopterin S-methyltransferase subunit C
LFGSAIAETVPHGPSVFYGALAASLALVYVIWKRLGVPVLRIGSVGVGIGILGYILALVSLHFPALAMTACIVLSVGSVVCWLTPLFTVTLAKLYPARSFTPLMVLLGLATILFHSSLLKIKPSTVSTYQKNIYSKLQINSKRELFAIAEKT